MKTARHWNGSPIVAAIILDDMGLARWTLRMHSLSLGQAEHGNILTALKNALSCADEKHMENEAGILWTWSRMAWESLESSWIEILREEVQRIPQKNCIILGSFRY